MWQTEYNKPAGEINLHINNGGVLFSVVDRGQGPEIYIQVEYFGANKSEQFIRTTPEGIKLLAGLFERAEQVEWSVYDGPVAQPLQESSL